MAQGLKKSNWFKQFMIFLLAVVVAISLGLVVYYFVQDSEVLSLDKNTVWVNKGENFTLNIQQDNGKNSTTYSLEYDETMLQLNNDNDSVKKTYEFKALQGGSTTIKLITNNERFKDKISCEVNIGDGTSEQTPYYIATTADLASIGKGTPSDENYRGLDKIYSQVADVDLQTYNNGAWTPLGNTEGFSGIYRGHGHKIFNLKVTATDGSKAGLFTKINSGALVTDIIFEKVTINGTAAYAGTVAGVNAGIISHTDVKDAQISSNFSGKSYIGGVVGQMIRENNTNTRLDRVGIYGDTEVKSQTASEAYLGGIVGFDQSGTIINSFSRAKVTATGASIEAGGIAGRVSTDNTIAEAEVTTSKKGNVINSYTTSIVGGDVTHKGAVVGRNINHNGTESYTNKVATGFNENRYVCVYYIYEAASTDYSLFWINSASSATFTSENGFTLITGISAENALVQETYQTYNQTSTSGTNTTNWDFTNVWTMDANINGGLPSLRQNNIDVADNIYDPQSAYDGLIHNQSELNLMNNDLTGEYSIGEDITLTSAWTPIGTQATPFTGKLNGNGYTINLGSQNTSLFGYIGNGAQIYNLHVIGANISSGTNVGILAQVNGGAIQNVSVAGNITLSGNVTRNIGGIVGINNGSILSSNSGTDAPATQVAIVVSNNGESQQQIGGVAGLNSGSISSALFSDSSYITATSISETVSAGGIVGINAASGSVTRSTSEGEITLDITSDNFTVGGIAGRISQTSTISLCKVHSATIQGGYVGGLVGFSSTSEDRSMAHVKQSQVFDTVNLKGNNAGGLIGRMYRGVMENCATYAQIEANTMAGFAVTVEGSTDASGNGNYAEINRCFHSVTFNGNGSAYAETTSKIRASNAALGQIQMWFTGDDVSDPDKDKIAGYINNSRYNSNCNGTRQDNSGYFITWNYAEIKDGRTSEEDCLKAETFSGFDANIWNIVDGMMPQIKF